MNSDLYYEPAEPSAFSSLKKQRMHGTKPSEIKSSLEMQDAYTLHKPLRRQLPTNPYTINNFLDVWEADLVDVQAFSKFL